MHPDLVRKSISQATIDCELLFFRKISRWWVFNRPEMMPTSTRDDWSAIRHTTTENDAFVPLHTKCWLGKMIRREKGNALLT